MSAARVLISEVGACDGLREIEVGSFVPPRLLPQMADVAEVVRHALTLPGLTVMAPVPNAVGAAAALVAGVHKLTISLSASVAHSLANVRKTPEQMLDELRHIVDLRDERAPAVHVEVGLPMDFTFADGRRLPAAPVRAGKTDVA